MKFILRSILFWVFIQVSLFAADLSHLEIPLESWIIVASHSDFSSVMNLSSTCSDFKKKDFLKQCFKTPGKPWGGLVAKVLHLHGEISEKGTGLLIALYPEDEQIISKMSKNRFDALIRAERFKEALNKSEKYWVENDAYFSGIDFSGQIHGFRPFDFKSFFVKKPCLDFSYANLSGVNLDGIELCDDKTSLQKTNLSGTSLIGSMYFVRKLHPTENNVSYQGFAITLEWLEKMGAVWDPNNSPHVKKEELEISKTKRLKHERELESFNLKFEMAIQKNKEQTKEENDDAKLVFDF